MLESTTECLPLKVKANKLHADAKLPEKNNSSDSGYDFFIVKDSDFNGEVCVLGAGQRKVFSTGISLELPHPFGMLLKDRSGMAVKDGIHVLAGDQDLPHQSVR